ncbi:MAG: hypothetical protein NUV47_02500 [Patescibacteria group bacterium]|nr:hypothetical protein [Patescibacteria group bacterium]
MEKMLKKYLPLIITGGVVYFIAQRYIFAKGKDKNNLIDYFKKLFGDREKQIQQESPEKLMYNVR